MCLNGHVTDNFQPSYVGENEQAKWERILAEAGLSMNRGKSRWLLSTDKTDIYQGTRDALDCALPTALKRARKPHKAHKPRQPIACTCQSCGKTFTAHRNDAVLCSTACRKRASRKSQLISKSIVRGSDEISRDV